MFLTQWDNEKSVLWFCSYVLFVFKSVRDSVEGHELKWWLSEFGGGDEKLFFFFLFLSWCWRWNPGSRTRTGLHLQPPWAFQFVLLCVLHGGDVVLWFLCYFLLWMLHVIREDPKLSLTVSKRKFNWLSPGRGAKELCIGVWGDFFFNSTFLVPFKFWKM